MGVEMLTRHDEEGYEGRELILYEEARLQIKEIIQNIKKNLPFSISPFQKTVSRIIDSLISESGDVLYNKALHIDRTPSLDLSSNMVNVCIFAIEIGMGLNYRRDDLERLALAAILHDIGMAKVDEDILKKPERLTVEEFNIVKKHTEYGAGILKGLGRDVLWMSEIIPREHERLNGRGYPNGLKDGEIHEYALIIGIADIYEALTHHRFHRKPLLPLDAMKEILTVERESFPERIIKAAISKLPVFPAGSKVRLNSNEIGIVICTNDLSPFRPTVEIILDSSGRKPRTKRIINLRENPLLFIVSQVYD